MTQCACGCKAETPLAKKTDARKGHVKGEPMRYIQGHFGRTMKRRDIRKQATTAVQLWDENVHITSELMAEIRAKCSRKVAAEYYDARTRKIEFFHRSSFIEQGLILNEMSEEELFREVIDPVTGEGFASFDRWLMDAAPVSRSGGYAAMKALRQLSDVPFDQLRHMARCNVGVLCGLSPTVRSDPDVIEAARNANERDFIKQVQEKYPDQHIESKRMTMATLDESARSLMDAALECARWVYDLTRREDALESIFAYFMEGPCEREGYSNRTNREAFQATKKRGAA